MLKKLTKEVLEKLLTTNFSWTECLIHSYELSEDFIRQYQNELEWCNICFHQKLSEDFIIEFQDKIQFDYLICNKWTETYITKFNKQTFQI